MILVVFWLKPSRGAAMPHWFGQCIPTETNHRKSHLNRNLLRCMMESSNVFELLKDRNPKNAVIFVGGGGFFFGEWRFKSSM